MENLMKELGFEPEDREALLSARRSLERGGGSEAFSALVQTFMEELPDDTAASEAALKQLALSCGVHPYTANLLFLLECSLILRRRYARAGFSDGLFLDTMRDLKWKLLECKDVYGVPGNFVLFWYPGFFQLTRFALGRLQFELAEFPFPSYEEQGAVLTKGAPVINMHVPSCGPLTSESWEASFARAMEFFSGAFPDGVFAFFIESWLIDPELIRLLPEGNMKRFSSLFTVLDARKFPDFPDGWRVFGKDWLLPASLLPRRTRLQKHIADFLAQGGRLGEGFGVFFRKG